VSKVIDVGVGVGDHLFNQYGMLVAVVASIRVDVDGTDVRTISEHTPKFLPRSPRVYINCEGL
jgi:hypothetical protein